MSKKKKIVLNLSDLKHEQIETIEYALLDAPESWGINKVAQHHPEIKIMQGYFYLVSDTLVERGIMSERRKQPRRGPNRPSNTATTHKRPSNAKQEMKARQCTIRNLCINGVSNNEIGNRLGISNATICKQTAQVRTDIKLGKAIKGKSQYQVYGRGFKIVTPNTIQKPSSAKPQTQSNISLDSMIDDKYGTQMDAAIDRVLDRRVKNKLGNL